MQDFTCNSISTLWHCYFYSGKRSEYVLHSILVQHYPHNTQEQASVLLKSHLSGWLPPALLLEHFNDELVQQEVL